MSELADRLRSACALQLAGRDAQGRPILAVLAKRSYRIERGRCVLAEAQAPLLLEPTQHPSNPELLLADADVFPYKLLSDVVVTGSAYNHPGGSQFETSVRIDAATKKVRVYGDRLVGLDRAGHARFSEPAPIDMLPLSYEFAYGGYDRAAEAKYGNPAELIRPYSAATIDEGMVAAASPFRYPRNPCGRGYIVEPDPVALEQVRLPNFEDPGDLLQPEQLFVSEAERWPLQPMAAGYGWLDYDWFPRCAHFGFVPEHSEDIDGQALPEVRSGYYASDIVREAAPTVRCANGAALGLSLPHLMGNERLEFENLHPRSPRLSFELPGERPRLRVDGREGSLIDTEPVIHTVHVDLHRELVHIVWRGSALARRLYCEELATMPFAAEWS